MYVAIQNEYNFVTVKIITHLIIYTVHTMIYVFSFFASTLRPMKYDIRQNPIVINCQHKTNILR